MCSYPTGNTAQGLCVMVGNVLEWVEDDWLNGYTGAPADVRPWINDPRGIPRILSGGNYNEYADEVRAANRLGGNSSIFDDVNGFRLTR